MTKTTILGLDTSQSPVRGLDVAVWEEGGELQICPQLDSVFPTLEEFVLHWKAREDAPKIAVPSEGHDALGIRTWLECGGHSIEAYEWLSYRVHLSNDTNLRNMGIDSSFRRAYALAVYAGYRQHAALVCTAIWARLLEAHHLLEDVRHDAHRLTAALVAQPPPLDIPF